MWREELTSSASAQVVNGLEWQPLTIFVVQAVEVFDPQSDESVEINQRYAALLLRSGLSLCLGREAACGDVDADILVAEDCEEGSESVYRDLGISLPFDLNQDAGARGAERIIVGDQVYASVGTRR